MGGENDLEAEVSRLQNDLVTAMNNLKESNSELSRLKAIIECLKSRENELSQKLRTIESERDALLMKIEKLEASGNDQNLMTKIKEWEKEKKELLMVKDRLEQRVKEMNTKVAELEQKIEEQENVITERDEFGLFDVNIEWPLVAASTVAAVAISILCYLRYGNKL